MLSTEIWRIASIYFLAVRQHGAPMNERPPSDRAEKIIVRLPDGMRDALAAVAKTNKRSTNAEVVAALEAWLQSQATVKNMPVAMLDRLSLAFARALENDPDIGPLIRAANSPSDPEGAN